MNERLWVQRAEVKSYKGEIYRNSMSVTADRKGCTIRSLTYIEREVSDCATVRNNEQTVC